MAARGTKRSARGRRAEEEEEEEVAALERRVFGSAGLDDEPLLR